MANTNLTSAKNAKNDECYTPYHDIEKEINAYLEFNPDVFRNKAMLLPLFARILLFNACAKSLELKLI